MTRTGCTLALMLWTCLLAAQPDSSLTPEFSQLSAKERARIARREQEEAAKDPQYQAVMAQAEDLFKQQKYDEALARFIEARAIRPYNVYPKVKIQDLQVLIAKRDAQAAAPLGTPKAVIAGEPKTVPPTEPTEQPEPTIVRAEAPAQAPLPEPKADVPAERTEPPVERQAPMKPRVAQPPRDTARATSIPHDPKPVLADGMTERTYKEGRAIVLERQVVADGKPVIYRKVTHPWGEPVHFKDGIAIPARVWTEAFGDK